MTPTTLPGHVPAVLADGQTHELGHHLSTEVTSITIGLRLRNQPALDQFLQDVNNPSSPRYHHFMTQDEANQPFDPTPDEEQRVVSWLRANGLRVTNTYPNHLLVDAQGTFGQIEQLLHVTLNDYQAPVHGKERVFFAPASDPAVDSSVADAVQSIIGLDNYPRFHRHTNGRAAGSAPYYPQNFADAYDVNPLWNAGYDGSGQHIGITLWTVPPSDSTLQSFGLATGANVPTTANGRLKVFLVDGGTNSTISPDDGEAGMDIEYSSAMAPRAIVDYYEAPTDSSGNPTDQGLLDALNQAGTDSNNNRQITNSWGGCEASAASDPWTVSAENIFSSNAATGHNYLFSSGDNGSWCDPTGNGTGQDPYPDYPASSPHVTAVGGTTFNANVSGRYPGESAWMYCPSAPTPCNSYTASSPEGSGGGYSKIFGRPSWQIGGGLPSNGARGYPDVSAAADPNTGAYVCYGATSACGQFGGTSLASPLWAGMLALVNQYLAAQGKASAGFVDPILYSLATHTQTYAPFHDITSGTNGAYNACPQWDAVTGWGSPDLFNLAQDIANPSGGSRSIGSSSCNQIYTRVSMRQYTLTGSDGNTWTDMDTSNLVLTITPGADSAITLSANADLWTSSAGYNQDLGIVVSGGGYTGIVAWKESGGAASYSPNAAFVHAVLSLQAGTTYTIKLQWKANRADAGTIAAGAGPLNGQFSPTRLTVEC